MPSQEGRRAFDTPPPRHQETHPANQHPPQPRPPSFNKQPTPSPSPTATLSTPIAQRHRQANRSDSPPAPATPRMSKHPHPPPRPRQRFRPPHRTRHPFATRSFSTQIGTSESILRTHIPLHLTPTPPPLAHGRTFDFRSNRSPPLPARSPLPILACSSLSFLALRLFGFGVLLALTATLTRLGVSFAGCVLLDHPLRMRAASRSAIAEPSKLIDCWTLSVRAWLCIRFDCVSLLLSRHDRFGLTMIALHDRLRDTAPLADARVCSLKGGRRGLDWSPLPRTAALMPR